VLRTAAIACLGLSACQLLGEAPPFHEPVRLGGKSVPAEVLNRGWAGYQRACRPCHGARGDGRGPSSHNLDPAPRDFTPGIFKFGGVPAGGLPRDEELRRIIREGLAGTSMLAWAVPEDEADAIAQYIKTFSPRWREEEPGEPIRVSPDPWVGRESEAVQRGRAVYHALAACQACHPAHATPDEIAAMARALGRDPPEPRAHPGEPLATDSDFGGKLRAPDLAREELRSAHPRTRLADLYLVIAAGVGGTGMPAWSGALPDADLWALARYCDQLAGVRKPGQRR
jgi:mono/diheme cytochrome c family protein